MQRIQRKRAPVAPVNATIPMEKESARFEASSVMCPTHPGMALEVDR